MIYGVYANEALVHWPPSKIFGDEIKVGLLFWSLYQLTPMTPLSRSLGHSRRRIVSLVPLHTSIAAK
jgi:hypothetical protein